MDFTEITQLIGSLGFPIVCCGYMMVTMSKKLEDNTATTQKLCSLIERLLLIEGEKVE